MKLYGYHHLTGEYGGETQADRDPLGGGLLIPACTTQIAPPAPENGEAIVWSDGAWGHVPDHRGEVWFDAQRRPVLVEAIGDPAEHGLTEQPAPWTADEQWALLRAERDGRLFASDWTQMSDVPLSSATVDAWRAYRQALRDLPGVTEDPAAPNWPEKP